MTVYYHSVKEVTILIADTVLYMVSLLGHSNKPSGALHVISDLVIAFFSILISKQHEK